MLSALLTPRVNAQVAGEPALQAGLGVFPGIGSQIAYIDQHQLYTREAVFYAHLRPGLGENEGSVQVSGSIGVSLRITGILETIGTIQPARYDIDVGARVGPGLTFAFKETTLEKNQRFSLTLEPIGRYTRFIGPQRFYVEAGIIRPSIRAGVVFSL